MLSISSQRDCRQRSGAFCCGGLDDLTWYSLLVAKVWGITSIDSAFSYIWLSGMLLIWASSPVLHVHPKSSKILHDMASTSSALYHPPSVYYSLSLVKRHAESSCSHGPSMIIRLPRSSGSKAFRFGSVNLTFCPVRQSRH